MNKAIIFGTIGTIEDKGKYLNLSVATKYGEKTSWHSCRAFKTTKDYILKYATKGGKILIDGTIDYYKTDDGKYFTTILINNASLAGSKPKADIVEVEEDDDGFDAF